MAEFVGVALLIIFGAGSACQAVLSTNPGVAPSERGTFLSINFGWAIGIAAGAWVSGGISGGHINPALTIAMATYGRFSWREVPGYIFAQVMGGIVGAGLVYANFIHAIDIFEGGRDIRTQATASLFATFALPYMTQVSCFFQEFLATAILCIVFLALNDKCTSFNEKRNGAPLNDRHNGSHLNGKSKGGPLNGEGNGAHLNGMRDGASLSDEGHGARLNRIYSGTTLNDNHDDAPANEIGPFALFILFIGLGASLGMQTGWAVNPARDFGPRVFLAMAGYGKAMFNYRSQYWIWAPIIAPILGALAGGLLYDTFLYDGHSSPIKWRRARQDRQSGEVV